MGPREPPRKSTALVAEAPVASPSPATGPGTVAPICHSGMPFADTKDRRPTMPSRRGWVRALGDRGRGGHSPYLRGLAQTLES